MRRLIARLAALVIRLLCWSWRVRLLGDPPDFSGPLERAHNNSGKLMIETGLKEKVVIVTGAAAGIGAGLCRSCPGHGADLPQPPDVVVPDRLPYLPPPAAPPEAPYQPLAGPAAPRCDDCY